MCVSWGFEGMINYMIEYRPSETLPAWPLALRPLVLILSRHKNGGGHNAEINPCQLTSKENQYRTSAHKRARNIMKYLLSRMSANCRHFLRFSKIHISSWESYGESVLKVLHNLCLWKDGKNWKKWVSDWPTWVSYKGQELKLKA